VTGIDLSLAETGDTIQGNFIGTDITGTLNIGNAGDGIHIEASSPLCSNIAIYNKTNNHRRFLFAGLIKNKHCVSLDRW